MTHRIERVNHLIRQEISSLLERQVKDPRLGSFVTITAVSTAADLKHATVFVSQIGDDSEREKILSALAGASGFIRSELAKNLRMRHIPELAFQWDESIARGAHILELIDRVTGADAARQPGAEPDPDR